MADKRLKIDLDIATKQAEQNVKNLSKATQDLGADFDTTKSKGAQIADAMKATADQVETELVEAKAAVDSLGAALGDEFKAKTEAGGAGVADMVAKLRNAGLTYDEIRADADQLADSIKRVSTAGEKLDAMGMSARRAGLGLSETHRFGSQTRSVMANLTGNAAQDLGQITGVAGTTGIALGQLAEYAADGNVNLAGMGAAAGGIALVGVALNGVAASARHAAEAKAFDAKEVKSFTDALIEGKSGVDAVKAALKEMGEIRITSFGKFGNFDLTEIFADLGVDIGTFSKLVTSSDSDIDAWREGMTDAGFAGSKLDLVIQAVRDKQDQLAEATKAAAVHQKVWGENTDEAAEAADRAAQAATRSEREHRKLEAAYDDLGKATGDNTRAADAHYRKLGEVDAKYDDVAGTLPRVKTREEELAASMQLVNDKIDDTQEKWDKLHGTLDDESAWLSLSDHFDSFAQDLLDTQTDINNGTLSWEEGDRRKKESLLSLKQDVLDYGEKIGLLPAQVDTLLTLADNGQIDLMEQRLTVLTRNREMEISITAKGGIGLALPSNPSGARASGGPVSAGGAYLVGEEGPELLVMGSSGGNVIPNGGRANRGVTVNLNGTFIGVEGPAVERWIVGALKDYKRRGGQL